MRSLLLVVFFTFCAHFTKAQNLDWQWGELHRNKGVLRDILSGTNGNFSTIHSNNQLQGAAFQLTQFEALSAVQSFRIKPVTPQGFGYYVHTLRQEKQHLVFIADRNGKEMTLYAKIFDFENNELDVRELIRYTDPSPNALPNFNIIEAPNKAFFAVYYQIPGKRNGTDTYGFQLYDQNLVALNGGEYNLPFDANLSSIEDVFLTNLGEFFLGVLELEAIENHGVRVRKAFKNLHVYQFNKDGLQDYSFDLQGKHISNFIMNAQHPERLTLFGIYSNKDWDGLQDGFFSAQLNLKTDTVMAVGFLPFSSEIMLSEYTAAEQMRLQRKLERRNEDPQLSRYEVRDIFTLADGSFVGSMEKYYVYTSTNYNNQTGQRMTTNYYYYNDIVAFCIDTNGLLRWEQRIPKIQVSVNDYGPYSSYASFLADQRLHFIFNDSRSNYSDEGFFNSQTQDLASFSLSKQRNVGAWVQIDLNTGQTTRQIIHERSTDNILLVPKAFVFDTRNLGMYTYGILGPQEKFGYIHLKN